MADMIIGSGSLSEVRGNEFLHELQTQLTQGQFTLTQTHLETALTRFPELVDPIMVETQKAGQLTQLFDDLVKGRVTTIPKSIFEEPAPAQQQPTPASSDASNDLFSIFDNDSSATSSVPAPAAAPVSAPAPVKASPALFKLKPPPGGGSGVGAKAAPGNLLDADADSNYNAMHQQQQPNTAPAADPFGLGGIDFNAPAATTASPARASSSPASAAPIPAPASGVAANPTRRPSGGGLLPPPPGGGNSQRRPSAGASTPPAANTVDMFAGMSATSDTTPPAPAPTGGIAGDKDNNPFDLF